MNENEVIDIMRHYIESQFPKVCPCCGKTFTSLKDYLQNTEHVGDPVSVDAEMGNWSPLKPIGTYALANCSCGTTLAITSRNMKILTFLKLMNWAWKETRKRNIHVGELLADLRNKIDKRVLQDEQA